MSWVCPNQIKDVFCKLRKKKCDPGEEGCVMPKFNFIKLDNNDSIIEKDKRKGKSKNK